MFFKGTGEATKQMQIVEMMLFFGISYRDVVSMPFWVWEVVNIRKNAEYAKIESDKREMKRKMENYG